MVASSLMVAVRQEMVPVAFTLAQVHQAFKSGSFSRSPCHCFLPFNCISSPVMSSTGSCVQGKLIAWPRVLSTEEKGNRVITTWNRYIMTSVVRRSSWLKKPHLIFVPPDGLSRQPFPHNSMYTMPILYNGSDWIRFYSSPELFFCVESYYFSSLYRHSLLLLVAEPAQQKASLWWVSAWLNAWPSLQVNSVLFRRAQ